MPKPTVIPQAFSTEPAPVIAMDSGIWSSQINSIGYDEATQTLAVTFKQTPGALYCYPDVPRATHEAFLAADSAGTYFAEHIKHLKFVKYRAPTTTEVQS